MEKERFVRHTRGICDNRVILSINRSLNFFLVPYRDETWEKIFSSLYLCLPLNLMICFDLFITKYLEFLDANFMLISHDFDPFRYATAKKSLVFLYFFKKSLSLSLLAPGGTRGKSKSRTPMILLFPTRIPRVENESSKRIFSSYYKINSF